MLAAHTIVPQAIADSAEVESLMGNMSPIKFTKRTKDATLPRKGTEGSAGYNLFPMKSVVLTPGERKHIPTGLSCEMPSNVYGQIHP